MGDCKSIYYCKSNVAFIIKLKTIEATLGVHNARVKFVYMVYTSFNADVLRERKHFRPEL